MIESPKHPDHLRFPDRVKRTRFRPEGDRSVLTDAVVRLDETTSLHVSEIRGADGEPSTYLVQRYRFGSPPAALGRRAKTDWFPEGEAETWDEIRVRLLLGLGGEREPFRVAIRTEESYIVAYLAPTDTMEGAFKVAVVHRAVFDLVEGAFERFKADVAAFSRSMLAGATGIPVEAISSREKEPLADA